MYQDFTYLKKLEYLFLFFERKWQQDISSFQHYELRHSMLSSSVMIIDAKATAIHFALPYCITTSILCTICVSSKNIIPENQNSYRNISVSLLFLLA